MQKNLWKEYLYFSRKERIALMVLLLVIGLLVILPRVITLQTPPPQPDLAAMNQLSSIAPATSYSNTVAPVAVTRLFRFDPNTLDAEGLLQLGLREKVVRTLLNYRKKGGHFYKAEDLRKIYGLQPEEANRLIPYITIKAPGGNAPALATAAQSMPVQQLPTAITAQAGIGTGKRFVSTDINTATADDWKRFPGIGEVLSRRIVAFRYKMGGFHSVQQVKQTYGLPDSVFERMLPYLRIDTTPIRSNNNIP
jgi:DNA uptake protein ComE-like DNA-binding protein